MIKENQIFVFGSNLQGIHGAGAALEAKRKYGAVQGVGQGLQGRSFAIPTKKTPRESLDLHDIEVYIDIFLYFAYLRNDLEFYVTRIGCGLAGYREDQIKPIFDSKLLIYGDLPNIEFTWTIE